MILGVKAVAGNITESFTGDKIRLGNQQRFDGSKGLTENGNVWKAVWKAVRRRLFGTQFNEDLTRFDEDCERKLFYRDGNPPTEIVINNSIYNNHTSSTGK